MGFPSQDGAPSPPPLSLFSSFIFFPTCFWRQWSAFLLPDVLCQHSEVVLWSLLSVEMFFWGIREGESGLPVLFLRHLCNPPVSIVSPSICHEVMVLVAMMLVFWMLSFKPAFSLFFSTLIKKLFSSYLLSAVRVVSSAYVRLTFSWQSWFHLVIHPTQYFAQNTLHIS